LKELKESKRAEAEAQLKQWQRERNHDPLSDE